MILKKCKGIKVPSKSWHESKYINDNIQRSSFDDEYFNKLDLFANGCYFIDEYEDKTSTFIDSKSLIKSDYERVVVHNNQKIIAVMDFIKMTLPSNDLQSFKIGKEFAMRNKSKVCVGKTTKNPCISYGIASKAQRHRSKLYKNETLCNFYQRDTGLGLYAGLMCLNGTRTIIDQCTTYDLNNPAVVTAFSQMHKLPSPYPLQEHNFHP